MSCGNNKTSDNAPSGDTAADTMSQQHYDLGEIAESGEIIAVTMYGRATYYEYHGRETGIAYDLLSKFAQSEGLGVRVETVSDTAAMIKMLASGEADIIMFQLPADTAKKHNLIICGMSTASAQADSATHAAGWSVRKDQPDLAEALDKWYRPGMESEASKQESAHFGAKSIRRHVRAPYVSRKKGIISQYDADFIRGSRYIGWDWRLIAAQCYQESGFDPNAESWAGAKGLMQLLPSTARSLGVKNIYNPQENIEAACKYLRRLQDNFSDVRNRYDKIRFVLAAYNGGVRHIRDAMNLAQKHGKSPYKYSDVSFFIRNLEKPQYYNDPVVHNGYMIGSETYNYVEAIMERWGKYRGGKAVSAISDEIVIEPKRSKRRNRFTRGRKNEILNFRDSL